MTDITPTAIKTNCLKALLENTLEIEFDSTGTYTLPKEAVVRAIIPGKCGGTGVLTTVRSVATNGTVTPAVISLTVGKSDVTNSVIVCME